MADAKPKGIDTLKIEGAEVTLTDAQVVRGMRHNAWGQRTLIVVKPLGEAQPTPFMVALDKDEKNGDPAGYDAMENVRAGDTVSLSFVVSKRGIPQEGSDRPAPYFSKGKSARLLAHIVGERVKATVKRAKVEPRKLSL